MSRAVIQAAEIVASGEGTKVQSIALKDALDQLQISRVNGDGRCLWHSIVVSFFLSRRCSEYEVKKLDREGRIVKLAKHLRMRVREELELNETGRMKDEYAPFWTCDEEYTGGAKTESEYLDKISSGTLFGGALELLAASKVLNCPFIVFNAESGDKTAQLSWHGKPSGIFCALPLFRRKLHYDAAKWRNENGESDCAKAAGTATRPQAPSAR